MTIPTKGGDIEELPSVTIITVCKNAEATIQHAMAIVAQCDYPRMQYVVIDGGSTDATCKIIEKYSSRVDKFISEPDRGISDALNKGMMLADGQYQLIVHADDRLNPHSLVVMGQSVRNRVAHVICGSVSVRCETGFVRTFAPKPQMLFKKMSVPHMGALISKEAWAAVGGYDVRRKIAMDHLLMLRILKRFGIDAFLTVDVLVADYNLGGVSDRQMTAGFREVRDNLLEEGVGFGRAQFAYVQLLLKARVARVIRDSR